MRLLVLAISATLLLQCCSPASTSSAPVVAKANDTPLTPLTPLDEQAVRELLAGVELELGDERARTETQRARAERAVTTAIICSVLAFVVGGATGAVITFGLTRR